ncbi:FAD-dependent oxidoreductase, partial [bacterium]|nr:FAD-dependent oxidoreductase [bacterium]
MRDVRVVGAGTGGCTAALWAARAVARTLILEARPVDEVGTKACVVALSDDGVSAISELGSAPRQTEIATTIT